MLLVYKKSFLLALAFALALAAASHSGAEASAAGALQRGDVCYRFCEDRRETFVNRRSDCPEDAPCSRPAGLMSFASFDSCGHRAHVCGGARDSARKSSGPRPLMPPKSLAMKLRLRRQKHMTANARLQRRQQLAAKLRLQRQKRDKHHVLHHILRNHMLRRRKQLAEMLRLKGQKQSAKSLPHATLPVSTTAPAAVVAPAAHKKDRDQFEVEAADVIEVRELETNVDCTTDPENVHCCEAIAGTNGCLLEGIVKHSDGCSLACQKRYASLTSECYETYHSHFIWAQMAENCDPSGAVVFSAAAPAMLFP